MNATEQHNADLDVLEALTDRLGLEGAIDLLAEVCSAKADHLEENWQDPGSAKPWDQMVGRLLTTAAAAADKGLSS